MKSHTFLQNSGPSTSLKDTLMNLKHIKTLMSLAQKEGGTLTIITALFILHMSIYNLSGYLFVLLNLLKWGDQFQGNVAG